MYQFFVEDGAVSEGFVYISGSDVHYIRDVIRLRAGETVRVSTASANYLCVVEEIGADFVRAAIAKRGIAGTELKSRIVLFQGLPKGDKMELVIQKAVELGAAEIVPVAMKHCVVKLDEKKAAVRTARWQSIAESAARQAKRSVIPGVSLPLSFAEAVGYAKTLDVVLLPYENESGMQGTKRALEQLRPGQSIGLFIGPEGGCAPEEIAAAGEGVQRISLGRRILRTETAGLAALSILMYYLELEEEREDAGISR